LLLKISAEKRKPSTPPTTGIDELQYWSECKQIRTNKAILLTNKERVVKEQPHNRKNLRLHKRGAFGLQNGLYKVLRLNGWENPRQVHSQTPAATPSAAASIIHLRLGSRNLAGWNSEKMPTVQTQGFANQSTHGVVHLPPHRAMHSLVWWNWRRALKYIN
jgi:hypothetical protein